MIFAWYLVIVIHGSYAPTSVTVPQVSEASCIEAKKAAYVVAAVQFAFCIPTGAGQ
jgi:hypothetical protein